MNQDVVDMNQDVGDTAEIIHVDFTPAYLKSIRQIIQQIGPAPTRNFLVSEGEHPSFIEAIFRKALNKKKRILETAPDVTTKS